MKENRRRSWLIALLSAALIVFMSARTLDAQEEAVVISGVVEVAEEDDDGSILSVFIHDSGWGDVLISNSGRGGELRNHIGAEVEAEGRVEMLEDADFGYMMYVRAYVLLDDPGDDGGAAANRR